MWLYVWRTLNQKEKEIIITLIENDFVNWKVLENKLKFSTSTISKYIDSLSNKGIN